MKKIIFLLAFLFATITNAQTPARHYGGVILGSFASDPTGVMEGQIYWNTTDNKFRAYDGTIWSDLVGGASLQSVLDTGDTWTSGSGFSTLTLGTSSAGSLVFRNTDENWGYNINSEQWSFTDALGNNSGMTYITTTEIAIGNNTNRANLNSTNITADRDFEFPNASGTFALTSDTANVSEWAESTGTRSGGDLLVTLGDYDNLGEGNKIIIDDSNNLVSIVNEGNDSFPHTFSVDEVTVNSGLSIRNNNNYKGQISSSILTANRNYNLPDASGTVALTSDIPNNTDYVDLTSNQTIDGIKTFEGEIIAESAVTMQDDTMVAGAGGYTLTFPTESGTIALTSDLSDYVDLTTAQTVGGVKTFTEDIEIGNNSKLLIEDTGGDFTDYDTSLAVAPVWESGHSDAVKIGKWNKLLVEQNASSTQYWNYNDVRLNGNTNANRYDMNWTGSYYNGTGGFSTGTTHSLNQMLIKNTTSGTRDFGFVYNQNNIITVDDDDGGTVTTTVEDYMTLFSQSNISDDNITINDHWLNLNQLNYDDGSIGELYGLNIDFNISGSADVTTTNHLLNLEYTNTSSGSVVSPYAIYSASDIPSFHRGDIEIGNASNILLDDNGSGSGASRLQWNADHYIEYDDQVDAILEIKGNNGITLNGSVGTNNNNIFVASGKVYTGGSGGSATIEQDDLKLVKGISGSPTVQGTAGAITHTISFDATGGSNTTLSTPNGYVGQIAVAHEKTPQIETGSAGGTTSSIDGKDFYYLKWTGGNGNETFNLPSATTNQYRTLQFITNSTVTANTTWTLDGSGAETIDGSATYVINRAYEGIKLWSDGTEWIIIQAKK